MDNRIIYIVGAGRSGTTLLDIILGNGDSLFSAGELNRFAKRDGIPHDARDEEIASFWGSVKKSVYADGFKDILSLNKKFKSFEYHSKALPVLLFKSVGNDFLTYRAFQESVFNAIFSQPAAKGKIIVDSSKYPLRAFFLSRIFRNQISYIYIKRDPVSVVQSFQKKDIEQPSKNGLMANLYLFGVNILASKIIEKLRKTNKTCIINYTDLLKSPATTLKQIEDRLLIDLSESIRLIESKQPLQIGFLFDGNRLRLQQEVIFKKNNTGVKKPSTITDKFFYPLHRFFWFK